MFQEIVDQSNMAVVVSDYETRKIIYVNDSVRSILGIDKNIVLEGKSVDILYATGKSIISERELSEFHSDELWEKSIHTSKGKYLRLRGCKVEWENRQAYAIYIIDETVEQELIHNVPGGLTIVELSATGECKMKFANNSWLTMVETTWEVFREMYASSLFERIYSKDRNKIKRIIRHEWGKSHIYVEEFRIYTSTNKIVYLSANLMLRKIDGSKAEYYCVFTDVTSQKEDRNELIKAQQKMNIIQENAQLISWEIDFENKTLTPDSHGARFFHTRTEKYYYPEIFQQVDTFDDESVNTILELIETLEDEGISKKEDLLVHFPDGQEKWIQIQGALISPIDEDGKRGLIWCRDISERKQMEMIYVNRISRSLNISDNTAVAYVLDLTENRVIESSSNNYKMFSQLQDLKVDEYLASICEESDNPRRLSAKLNPAIMLEGFAKGIRRKSVQYYNKRKNKDFECSYEVLQNPYNEHIESFISFTDITESVKMEKIVQSLIKMNYEAIYTVDLNTMMPTVYKTTEKGRIQRVREEGINYQEYIYHYLSIYGQGNIEEQVIEENSIERVRQELKTNSSYTTSFLIQNESHKKRHMKCVFRYLDDYKETLLVIMLDVTEEYESEKKERLQLEMALQDAKKANAAKTDFLSRVSHDIRTPMNAILGLTRLAKEEQINNQVRDYLNKINSSSEFLLRLVNDILDMSKIENGNIEMRPEPVSSEMFYQEISTIVDPLVKERNVNFHLIKTKVSRVFMVDRLRFNQIFFNLLSNAIKFTPEGGDVYLFIETIPGQGTKIGRRYHIKDTGVGMSEEFQKKIFEPFEQEENSLSDQLSGTGLGTTIVKRIVDAMGGKIQVQSAPEEGTEFIVDLYIEPAEEMSNNRDLTSVDQVKEFLNGKKVLLVEDNEMNILVAKTQLTKIGVDVTVAINGKEAVEIVQSEDAIKFDAILMDRRMPVMDGIEATKIIRRNDKETPIIAMTADAFDEDTRLSLDAGMNAHLTKPVVPEKLYRTLAACMQ